MAIAGMARRGYKGGVAVDHVYYLRVFRAESGSKELIEAPFW